MALVALSLVIFALPLFAQNSGPSANGSFSYTVDGGTRTLEFNARTQGSSTKGQLTFSGPADIPDQDVDGDGTTSAGTVSATFSVDFDCLKLTGNRAAMSGLVTSSNVSGYNGRRIVLAVEDNGEGSKAAPDRYTWGVYVAAAGGWVPSDAEVVGDNGAMFSWLATDSERFDDVGFQYHTTTSAVVDCQSFPLTSYPFDELPQGAGNIQVRP